MNYILVVGRDFAQYKVGTLITDPSDIAAVERLYSSPYVVRIPSPSGGASPTPPSPTVTVSDAVTVVRNGVPRSVQVSDVLSIFGATDQMLTVTQSGSTGIDFSANPVSVSGTPLVTIPATPGRAYVEVQNQSANQLQIVRDDGAGNNVTSILLTGVGANQQGGGWSSATFKGRVRVYGPVGSQVSAYQE